MRILITGGTGLLGQALCAALRQDWHQLTVYSRTPSLVHGLCGDDAEPLASLDEWRPDQHFDAIINLAGEPIADLPWTPARKQKLRESRIGVTRALLRGIEASTARPAVFISASAVGVYGDAGNLPCSDLVHAPHSREDFASTLCADWESVALGANEFGIRTCLLRSGLVLAPGGGLLGRMKLPFLLGLGGRFGDGQQWMSWIHIADWVNAVRFLLGNASLAGAFNLTAPTPARNAEFTRELGLAMHRPTLLNMPDALLRIALGQRSGLVLGGQKALPDRLLAAGFEFAHPGLGDALRNCLR